MNIVWFVLLFLLVWLCLFIIAYVSYWYMYRPRIEAQLRQQNPVSRQPEQPIWETGQEPAPPSPQPSPPGAYPWLQPAVNSDPPQALFDQQLQELQRGLLTLVQGDQAMMAKFIDYEQRRNPSGSEIDWYRDAADRIIQFLQSHSVPPPVSSPGGIQQDSATASIETVSSQVQLLRSQLFDLVQGDQVTVDRLVDYYHQRNPSWSETECYQGAIDHLLLDRQ